MCLWLINGKVKAPKDSKGNPLDIESPPSWDPQIPRSSKWQAFRHYVTSQNEIPNIAHFVRQINRDAEGLPRPFHVEFRHLLSYYSCYYFLRPEKIYFWTDASQELLHEASISGDQFTKAFFRLPSLSIQSAVFPNITEAGVPIKAYAHRSDFVRTRVMAKMGGVYLDDDAWVLRDLKPLRQAGFDNVFSLDTRDRIAQAAWLSKPSNPLIKAFANLQDSYFDGQWLHASNDLITSLMRHFSRMEGDRSSLVLEKDAFYPGKWSGNAVKGYYQVHDIDPQWREPQPPKPEDLMVEPMLSNDDWAWRYDWRRSWIVHGFSGSLRARNDSSVFGEFESFTPEYILSQRSNIARALYPAAREMIASKFISAREERPVIYK